MWERLLITLLLILVGSGAFLALRRLHMQRVNRGVAALERPSLLYFRSDNCPPCLTQTSYLQEVERLFAGRLAIQKIDADVEKEKAAGYGIFTLPTTLVVDRGGQVKYINYGLTAASKLARQLESVL